MEDSATMLVCFTYVKYYWLFATCMIKI